MLRSGKVLWMLVFVCLVSFMPTNAQQQPFPATPLLIGIRNPKLQTYEGDIWAWDGSGLSQRTRSGYIFAPIVSPRGDSFVYLEDAPAYVKYHDPDTGPIPPQDISRWDLRTSQITPLAVQPDPTANAAEILKHDTLRSQPAWSPDGGLLAWTEITTDTDAGLNTDLNTESLVVYYVATNQTHTLVTPLPAHRFAGKTPLMSDVSIGPDGIFAVRVHVSQNLAKGIQDNLYFYDQAGKLLAEVDTLKKVDPNYQDSAMIWLSGLDKPYLSCIICSNKIDPHTGSVVPLNGSPEMYSPLAPDKLSVYYGSDSGDESNVTWIIALNGKPVSSFDFVRIANTVDMAISPDGRQVAAANYIGQGTTAGVLIYQSERNQMVKITTNVYGMGWGPTAWRVHPAVSPG